MLGSVGVRLRDILFFSTPLSSIPRYSTTRTFTSSADLFGRSDLVGSTAVSSTRERFKDWVFYYVSCFSNGIRRIKAQSNNTSLLNVCGVKSEQKLKIPGTKCTHTYARMYIYAYLSNSILIYVCMYICISLSILKQHIDQSRVQVFLQKYKDPNI